MANLQSLLSGGVPSPDAEEMSDSTLVDDTSAGLWARVSLCLRLASYFLNSDSTYINNREKMDQCGPYSNKKS